MKVRQQTARPCERKGKDNNLFSFSCELRSKCSALKEDHRDFCLKIEESLVQDGLVRYETKEITGLHVLFNGIEKTFGSSSEDLIDDDFLYDDIGGSIDNHFKSLNTREYEVEEISTTSEADYRTSVMTLNSDLGFNKPKSTEIFSSSPSNLYIVL